MEHTTKLLLALGITEWSSVSAHMEAMRKGGISIPTDVFVNVARETGFLIRQWPIEHGQTPEGVVAEARRYVTAHLDEAEALLGQVATV